MVTLSLNCPCCNQQVEASYKGFESTSVTVAACDIQRASGVVSYTIRRSAAMALEVPEYTLRHSTGLVAFA